MTDQSPSAGYLAFPDFHTAALWYALFGRPSPDLPPKDKDQDNESQDSEENQSDENGEDTKPSSEDNSMDEGEANNEDEPKGESRLEESELGSEDSDIEDDLDAETMDEAEDYGEAFELIDPIEQPASLKGYRKVQVGAHTEIIREFNSWYEFVTCIRDTPQAWDGGSRTQENNSFFGTSLENAIQMGLGKGWPEGRQYLRELSSLVVPQPQQVEVWDYDIAGGFPCVPAYCAGDPACMVSEAHQEQRNAHPVVRIDFNINARASISKKTFITRGAAMLSFAETLERQGYSTEIRIVSSSADDLTHPKYIHRTSIAIKPAGEPIDLDRVMFAIAHPATHRRLLFALFEQAAELEGTRFKGSYGYSIHEPVDPTSGKPGGAIFIPGPKSNSETAETAKQIIEEAAQAAGFVDETFAQAA